jgi:hypothetical protein
VVVVVVWVGWKRVAVRAGAFAERERERERERDGGAATTHARALGRRRLRRRRARPAGASTDSDARARRPSGGPRDAERERAGLLRPIECARGLHSARLVSGAGTNPLPLLLVVVALTSPLSATALSP